MTQIKKYQRINVRVGVDLNKQLDELAFKFGMTKASLVSYFIGKAVALETKQSDLMTPEAMGKLFQSLPGFNDGMLELLERSNKKYDNED